MRITTNKPRIIQQYSKNNPYIKPNAKLTLSKEQILTILDGQLQTLDSKELNKKIKIVELVLQELEKLNGVTTMNKYNNRISPIMLILVLLLGGKTIFLVLSPVILGLSAVVKLESWINKLEGKDVILKKIQNLKLSELEQQEVNRLLQQSFKFFFNNPEEAKGLFTSILAKLEHARDKK